MHGASGSSSAFMAGDGNQRHAPVTVARLDEGMKRFFVGSRRDLDLTCDTVV